MFEGFEKFKLEGYGAIIHGVKGGKGPPLLLLHGYPQTHVIWHKVSSTLAKHFTIIATDLRGYGASSKPKTDETHSVYSKRVMANDMIQIMEILGYNRFMVAGHDRGGRVAHRMALDWPDCVERISVLDIAPTREMYQETTDEFARAYWHWFFLIQTYPFPENMILANPKKYWLKKCGSGSAGLKPFTPEALQHYLDAFNEETIHSSCEDYRAAATIDIEHDNNDGERKIECPLLALWGKYGVIENHFDCLGLWKKRALNVTGEALPGGHYLAEELPDLIIKHFIEFFSKRTSAKL